MAGVKPGLSTLPNSEKRASYNYWTVDDEDYMKAAMISRYEKAARFVSGHVLDLACGWGYGSTILAEKGEVLHVGGIDEDPEAIDEAKQQVAGSKWNGLIDFSVGDLNEIQIPSSDWVVTLETVEHLKNPLKFINECKARAQVGIVISVPIGKTTHRNRFHLHDFEIAEIQRWFWDWREVGNIPLIQVIEQDGGKKVPKSLGWVGAYMKDPHHDCEKIDGKWIHKGLL